MKFVDNYDMTEVLYGAEPITVAARQQKRDDALDFFMASEQEMRNAYESAPKPWLDYCKVYALDRWDFHRPGGSVYGCCMDMGGPDENLGDDLAVLNLRTEYTIVTRACVEKGEVLDELPFPGLTRMVIVPPQLEADILKVEWAEFARIQVNPWLPIADGKGETCYIVDLGAVNLFRYRRHESPEMWLRRRDYEHGWPATAYTSHCVYAELVDESKVKRWIP